jgi:hypothetical protein
MDVQDWIVVAFVAMVVVFSVIRYRRKEREACDGMCIDCAKRILTEQKSGKEEANTDKDSQKEPLTKKRPLYNRKYN